jgi:hypothetical protein
VRRGGRIKARECQGGAGLSEEAHGLLDLLVGFLVGVHLTLE